jgi:hypothetical protein
MNTYNLSRTRTRGITRPIPIKKLMIFDTSVSKPAMTRMPPKTVDPMYPAERIAAG